MEKKIDAAGFKALEMIRFELERYLEKKGPKEVGRFLAGKGGKS